MNVEKHKEYYKTLALNISYYRKQQSITQLELAEMVDISRQHMARVESPNVAKSISTRLLFNIADALKIRPYQLLEER